MSEVKDPKIKLFGKTIELPDASVPAAAAAVAVAVAAEASGEVSAQPCEVGGEDSSNQDPPCSPDSIIEDSNLNRGAEEQESSKSPTSPKQDHTNEEDGSQPLTSEDIKDSNTTLPMIEDSNNTPSADSDGGSVKTSKPAEDQGETDNSGEKTLKKPDKILQCPRCNSMDTKFCYFNNYNVNQPRHFCKNCQRYWTAGGTMRNVPVGAGRRKNKNSISQFRHQTVPEALSNGIHHPALNPNGTVLTFSSDAPLCESMVSALNIVDKTIINGSTSKPEDKGDDGAKEETGRTGLPSNCNLFPPCYPGAPPWPYPYLVQWGPGSFPVPFYSTALPPPYLGCALPGPWSVPWVIPPTPTSSGPTSPTIGKHSRDENVNPKVVDAKEVEMRKESDSENKCLWVPKTLRIDDPGEAAKSSIWATLGIKDGRSETVGGGGRFKAFERQTKGDEKKKVLEPSIVLQANPAALSRSVNFHESS